MLHSLLVFGSFSFICFTIFTEEVHQALSELRVWLADSHVCEVSGVFLSNKRTETICECRVHCCEVLVPLLGMFPLGLEVQHLVWCPCLVDVEDGSRVLWVLWIGVLAVRAPDDLWKAREQ